MRYIILVKATALSEMGRCRASITTASGEQLEAQGNLVDTNTRSPMAGTRTPSIEEVVPDSYGVEIEPGRDPIPILTATVAIDMMAHD